MNQPDTLRARIRAAAVHGDWPTALRIAASCPQAWGPWAPTIARAHEANWHPGFGRQLGRSPAEDIANGINALRHLLNLTEETSMKTRPRSTPESGPKKPARLRRKPKEPAAGTDTAPELEAALAPAKPAPLEMTREELEHGGTRIGVGQWQKSKDGADIVVTLDRATGSWACEIERNGHRVRRQGRGYLTICRQAISDLNAKEQTQ